MNRYMAEKSNQGGSRYDREGLIEWANRRFDADLDVEDFRELSRGEVQQRLLEVSEQFRGKTMPVDELEKQLDIVFPRDTFVPAAKLVPISEWTEKHIGERIEFGQPMLERKEVRRRVLEAAERKFRPEIHEAERSLLLQFLDTGWKDHLYAMDHLKSGIGLVGYAQIDPKVEYKRKGKDLFEEMWEAFERKVTEMVYRVEEADASFVNHLWNISTTVHEDFNPQTAAATDIRSQQQGAIESNQSETKVDPIRNRGKRVGRNDLCTCGSGKKYKNCCMT